MLKTFFHKRVDGVIASLSFDTEDLSHFQRFVDKVVPVIFLTVWNKADNTVVIIDNYKYVTRRHSISLNKDANE